MNNKQLLEVGINEYIKYKEIISNYRDFNKILVSFKGNTSDIITTDGGQEFIEIFFEACNMRVYNMGGRPLVENLFEVFGEDERGDFITVYDCMTLAEAKEILKGLR